VSASTVRGHAAATAAIAPGVGAQGFTGNRPLAWRLLLASSGRTSRPLQETTMQLESMMLRSLAVTCSLVCVLVLGAMLTGAPANAREGIAMPDNFAAMSCQTPPDAVVCPLPAG
jgi:hypothetical protein